MNTTLETLIQVQELDTAIQDIQRRIEEFPQRIQQLDALLSDKEKKLTTLQSMVEEQESTRRSKEREVESNNERMKKYQTQLTRVKTNKEYTALLSEIKGLKSKNSLIEDDILELMEGVERAKQSIVAARRELDEERTRIQQEKQRLQAEAAELQQELEQEQARRDQLADTVESSVLKEYTKLLKLRHGVAVTAVREGGICTGCHVALTPQMFAEVKTGEYLHRCPTCVRFLYWIEQDSEQE